MKYGLMQPKNQIIDNLTIQACPLNHTDTSDMFLGQ